VRAVVTGGAGFIGSTLVDTLLSRGDDVHVVDDLSSGRREQVAEEATLHVLDVREPLADAFAEARPDAVFHLAAQANVRVSVADPAGDARTNVIGTVNVLEAARGHGAQVIFASTGGAIYGECERPATEDEPRLPVSPYGTSKLAGEEYLAAWNRLYGTHHVALRLGNVYGPRQDPHGEAGVVAIFSGRLLSGERPQLRGEGRPTRDYVHVSDVAASFAAAGAAARPGTYNVGTGRETSAARLLDLLQGAAGTALEPEQVPLQPGELHASALDASLIERELGWRPTVAVEEGLAETLDWYRRAGR
jgi:UDP-glucose 4-epimerase